MRKHLLAFALALGVGAGVAQSAEAPRDAFSFPIKLYLLLLGMALLGGFVSWYTKVIRGELQWTSMHHLIGELTTSAFAGLLAFYLCEYAGIPPLLEAPIVGIAGHAGARTIAMIENGLYKRYGAGLHERRNPTPPSKTVPGELRD